MPGGGRNPDKRRPQYPSKPECCRTKYYRHQISRLATVRNGRGRRAWHVDGRHIIPQRLSRGKDSLRHFPDAARPWPRFPGCQLPKATLLRSSTPGKAERAGTWVNASREVAQTQLFGAAPRIWRVLSSSPSIMAARRLLGCHRSSLPILMPGAAAAVV